MAHVPGIMFGLALVVSSIIVVLMSRGELDRSQLFFFVLVAALAYISAILSSSRKIAHDPALDIIERCIQPREEDRNLIARRRKQRNLHLSEARRKPSASGNAGLRQAHQYGG